jgi:uncharacterized membrane protein
MMNKIKIWWVVLGFSSLLLSCTNEIDFDSIKPTEPEEPELAECTPGRVYFRNDIMPILESHCAVPGCHDASTPAAQVNLSSYDAIMKSAIKGDLIVKPGDRDNSLLFQAVQPLYLLFMPPPRSHQMTPKMRSDIGKWIQQGAVDDICRTDCADIEPKFQSVIKPLIDKYCTGCHYDKFPYGGVKLFNYAEIVAVAESGLLVKSMRAQDGVILMPPGSKMPECEIQLIEAWIERGMPRD